MTTFTFSTLSPAKTDGKDDDTTVFGTDRQTEDNKNELKGFILGQHGTQAKHKSFKGEKKEEVTWAFGANPSRPISFSLLDSPWRNVSWTQDTRETLMEMVKSYKPASDSTSEARVLLLGPAGAGKSSFISSVQSVFSGRVLNRAMVGSTTTLSFTKKFQSFNIRKGPEKVENSTALLLCDVMGFGEDLTAGLTLHDALCIIQGHVPEGYQFSPEQPVKSDTPGFIKEPSLKHKVHCVVFVVDATKVNTYPKGMSTTFQKLREHISNLGVHQVALLTHVDEACKSTAEDITHVYRSIVIQQLMVKAGALLGMATSYIVPVKNYSSQLELEENTDILLLSAVDHILQYVDLYFQDRAAE